MARPMSKPKEEKGPDLMKIVDDLRALKTRHLTMELQRLDEERNRALQQAVKQAEGSKGKMSADEARKYAESESDRSKEMLESRYKRLDVGIQRLADLVREVGGLDEYKGRLQAFARTLEDQNKQVASERKELDSQRGKLQEELANLEKKSAATGEAEQTAQDRAGNLDIVKRAEELDLREKDLQTSMGSYNEEMMKLEKAREELNKDFDNLGRMQAELESEREAFRKEVEGLGDQMRQIEKDREAINKDADNLGRMRAEFESQKAAGGSQPAAPAAAPAPQGPTIEEMVTRLTTGFEKMVRDMLSDKSNSNITPSRRKRKKG